MDINKTEDPVQNESFGYDANGNIIYKQNKQNGISYTFEYSALNQLKKAIVTSPYIGSVFTGFVSLVGYAGAASTVISIRGAACNKDTGSYYGSDICR